MLSVLLIPDVLSVRTVVRSCNKCSFFFDVGWSVETVGELYWCYWHCVGE